MAASLRKRARVDARTTQALPDPALADLAQPYDILVTGIGGTGIVTIGALLGMAAHLDGPARHRARPDGHGAEGRRVFEPYPHRRRRAAICTACASAAARPTCCWPATWWSPASKDALATLRAGVSRVVLNTHEVPTGDFVHEHRHAAARRALAPQHHRGRGCRERGDRWMPRALATALLGDAIATNLFLLGYAWQKGCVPLSRRQPGCGRSS